MKHVPKIFYLFSFTLFTTHPFNYHSSDMHCVYSGAIFVDASPNHNDYDTVDYKRLSGVILQRCYYSTIACKNRLQFAHCQYPC